MGYLKNLILFSLLSILVFPVKAQKEAGIKYSPPVFMEAFAGDRSLAYQLIIDKKLQSVPRLGFFSVSDIRPEWGEPQMSDYMIQGNLTYSIIRGIDLSGGFIWNPVDGVRPTTGLIFKYGSPKVLAVVNPRIDVAENPNFDALGLFEYKPPINDKFNLYTRLQGLYSYNFGHEFHTRSYLMLRAGLTWKDITFGPAVNFDRYGPTKISKNNIGGFIAVNLF